jgi:malate permease and related proteins
MHGASLACTFSSRLPAFHVDPVLLKIVSILAPVFTIVVLGYFYARKHESDMTVANRLNMHVFTPALIFAGLATRSYDIGTYGLMALGMVAMVLGSGVVAMVLTRITGVRMSTLGPSMMFNNGVNLGVPLAMLTFGNDILPLAILLFVVSALLHFSLGIWIIHRHAGFGNILRNPVVLASLGGLATGALDIHLWPPLYSAVHMLGDISIPLALFGLGVRLTDGALTQWRIGAVVAIARPVAGMLIAWAAGRALHLEPRQAALLLLYGALPPAVMNYVFAEHYRREPDKVASIVLIGNFASVVFLPIALALVL